MLANMANKYQGNRGFASLKHYLELRVRDGVTLADSRWLKKLSSQFQGALQNLGFGQFTLIDNRDLIRGLFLRNIPYVTKDIRELINWLPFPEEVGDANSYVALF